MPLDQGAVRVAALSIDRVRGEPSGPVRARFARPGLHNALPQEEAPSGADPVSRGFRAAAPAGGQTGIKFSGEGEWQVRKHGASRRRQWRKIHAGVDADTLEVRAVEVTSNRIGDAPVLPDLLAQIPVHERIGSVTAEGIYDTKGGHTAIAARGADAIIPPPRNARDWKGHNPGLQAGNEALRACKRFGRANWKKWSGYHRRSRVEAKMRCLKLLGERIMARDFDRKDAEVQIRIALMNRFTSLGTPETLRMR